MPRAALLSIHARVEGTTPSTWRDPSLVQLWGPRYSAYVVAARDVAPFSLGRLPDNERGRARAADMAARLRAALGDGRMGADEVATAIGVHNAIRYAATTGSIRISWDGARQPLVWMVAPPSIDPAEARLELARRYLHVFGPTTPASFADWAGLPVQAGRAAFDALGRSLAAVRTPLGDAWILARDESAFRADPRPPAPVRLLPSGDAYTLLQGADRPLLVPEARRRGELWTPRVWPGAILLEGEIRGTWRRAHATVTAGLWGRPSRAARAAVEAEAAALPLPGVDGRVAVRWGDVD
jgi:Winged helix DNA-binding domain